mmetsp:Transcript_25812/g.50287  ORF Transcript_25812/g.50287 Transcript_25812/m.50287 type:complete len:205 (-) Transcript_25812:413-1027(-)
MMMNLWHGLSLNHQTLAVFSWIQSPKWRTCRSMLTCAFTHIQWQSNHFWWKTAGGVENIPSQSNVTHIRQSPWKTIKMIALRNATTIRTLEASGEEMTIAHVLNRGQVANQVGCTLVNQSEETARSKNTSVAPREVSGYAKKSTKETSGAETRIHGLVEANRLELPDPFTPAIRAKRKGPSSKDAVKPTAMEDTRENMLRITAR